MNNSRRGRLVCLLITVFALSPDLCAAQTASEQLERLAVQANERELDLFPLMEVFSRGPGPRQDRIELTLSDEHRERQRAHHRWILGELERISIAELTDTEQLTHALLGWQARDSLEWLTHPFHQRSPLLHLRPGIAFNLIDVIDAQPFRDEADYHAWFRRLRHFMAFLANAEDVMREGIIAGITTPRVLVEFALAQLNALTPKDVTTSTFWKPILQLPPSIDAETRATLEADYRSVLADELFPALRQLAAFGRNEYQPKARTTNGFGALPGGDAMYRYLVRSETTTDLTPDEIHALGLSEMKRIQAGFLAAAQKAGFNGKVGEITGWLRDKPDNYPFTSGEEILKYLEGIQARIVPQLPTLFGRLPKSRFEIRLADPAIAARTPPRYMPPNDAGRPGVFAMPVVDPRKVSRADLATILAHEGMPGHHLDAGIKLENSVPDFRRRMWINAFGEGWALYAESLGHELGLYEQPLDLIGRYAFDLLRACRLVVDTGVHAEGWTHAQAIGFLLDECGQTQSFATTEVLRYMAWPAQALSYKTGELAILELRAQAEKRLGARFDLRAFHDVVLAEGHLPISMMRQRVKAWIEKQGK